MPLCFIQLCKSTFFMITVDHWNNLLVSQPSVPEKEPRSDKDSAAHLPSTAKSLKNKAVLCKPLVQNKGVSCRTQTTDGETQTSKSKTPIDWFLMGYDGPVTYWNSRLLLFQMIISPKSYSCLSQCRCIFPCPWTCTLSVRPNQWGYRCLYVQTPLQYSSRGR